MDPERHGNCVCAFGSEWVQLGAEEFWPQRTPSFSSLRPWALELVEDMWNVSSCGTWQRERA